MPIRFLDMFAGIGGFRSGLERLGSFECVGYCEIDKYAKQAYDAMYPTKGELYFADARTIDPYTLPDIDLICGGFPCQSFSIAAVSYTHLDVYKRQGLVSKDRLFSENESAYLCRCVDFTKGNCETLTYEQERQLDKLQEKLTDAYPSLEAEPPTFEQESAPQQNM